MKTIICLMAILMNLALINSQTMCTNIPSNHQYYLTSFCDATTACGPSCGNCQSYYSADSQRFGCGSQLNCCQGTKCVNLKVIDAGPACSLEKQAGKPIIDASYSTCKYFTGSQSCGWSDKILITCNKISVDNLTNIPSSYQIQNIQFPLGPCTFNQQETTDNLPHCLDYTKSGVVFDDNINSLD